VGCMVGSCCWGPVNAWGVCRKVAVVGDSVGGCVVFLRVGLSLVVVMVMCEVGALVGDCACGSVVGLGGCHRWVCVGFIWWCLDGLGI
jgi:hypothetical protein